MNHYFSIKQHIEQRIGHIPKKNRVKFQCDYLKLIELAQKDNYENVEIVEN